MGIDSRLIIKFNQEPTIQEIKKLQYRLLSTFDSSLFLWSYKHDEKYEDFINLITDGKYYFDTDFDATGYYDINLTCRYYGPKYERGPGLEIAGILLFLTRNQPNIIEVRYGGDSSGCEGIVYNHEEALKYLYYFLDNNTNPYHSYFTRNPNAPICEFCNELMSEFGGGGNVVFWQCLGCGQKKNTTRDGELINDRKQ